nr:hypothetical protein GCM10020093_040090 [Planobispora longispora]
MTLPMLSGELHVITAGTEVLGEALDAQAVPRVTVDWRPPLPGTEDDLARVLADPRRAAANDRAVGG